MFVRFVFIMMCLVVAIENVCAQPNQYIQDVADNFENKIKHTERVKLDSDSAEYIKRLSKFSDSVEYELKTLYFTEKTLWQLYDDLSAIINKKSEQTGREVKKIETKDEQTGEWSMYIGLDWGEYEECEITLCESYPDDIEQCSINMTYWDVSDDMFGADLFFYCDNKKENRTNSISFMVNGSNYDTQDDDGHVLEQNLFVSLGGTEEKYDEVYQYKNDVLAAGRANLAEMRKNKKKTLIEEELWLPDADVFEVNFSSSKYNHKTKSKK